MRKVVLSLVGVSMLLSMSACARPLERFEFTERHMGTMFKVVMYAPDETAAESAATDAFARVAELNDVLSDYHATSEIRRLSAKSGSGEAVTVSDDLYEVLRRSVAFSEMSDGAFDVTVGPVIRLWRHARRHRELPRKERLDEAMRAVGWRRVVLNPADRRVKLTAAEMRLDVGGIAKGYTCDEVLRVLRERHGIRRALVDAGGDLSVSEPPPDKDRWRIALPELIDEAEARAIAAGGKPKKVRYLHMNNGSVATSGDVFQHVVIDGVKYSHIVDPRTGVGLTTPMTVTVVAPDGATADALASAISVMGPGRGLALADTLEGVAALVIYRAENGDIETRRSKQWSTLAIDVVETE